ncbi:signal transduction histidine kinase with CheB and CheR activity [Flammeovirgaceae bacterium 311]|nr:signal transduction histidine kinase with CheB and CheR activity [Flammeovirgaceae bacterium 311]
MPEDFYVVGIGASAGGLEAFESFIAHLPVDPQLALILIRHLAPQHKSLSDKLLQKHTAYPIYAIEDGMVIAPGNLYVLTKSHKLELRNNQFQVTKTNGKKRKLYPIDYFFGSLAESYGPRAIAVLLSGAGTDGSFGIEAITNKGGQVLVQSPEEAEVDGMPSAALASGFATFTAPVAVLGKWILDWVHRHDDKIQEQKQLTAQPQRPHELEGIIQFISANSELNLKEYKPNTLYRRIGKRMGELQMVQPALYLELLQKRPEEVQRLKQSLLIGFTDFFRDAEVFEAVTKEVIPYLLKNQTEADPLRVWCAGCSTGEEAYTLAILLNEFFEGKGMEGSFTIFASDINEDSLKTATEGKYQALPGYLTPEQAGKYFYEQGGWFYVRREIRKKLVFARHNLLKNPPFINIDLVTCRNVLIYLNTAAQKKLFMKFHFALKPGGVMILGSNESNGAYKKLFRPLNKKWKIYINNVKQEKFSYISGYLDYSTSSTSVVSMKRKSQADNTAQKLEYYEQVLLDHIPPSIFLNADQEVVYTQGKVDDYIKFRGKQPSLQVLDLLDDTLKVIFRSGMRKLEKDGGEAFYSDIVYASKDEQRLLSLRFQKIKDTDTDHPLMLVQFFPQPPASRVTMAKAAAAAEDNSKKTDAGNALDELERELNFARLELQQTSEELELTNEKLQTANEELLSANEELQSMNEELQSANEELSTLNSELNESLLNLHETHNDLSNLINAAEIGVIFLDEQLRIRKFTPLTKALFNIQEADSGRYLKDFTNNFNYSAFEQDAHKVLELLSPLEKEVLDLQSGTTYLMRILPYKTQENKVGGVVLLLVDISGLKHIQDQILRLNDELKDKAGELERAESSWRSLMTHLPDVVARYDRNLNLMYISDAFFRDTGQSADYWVGKHAEDIAIEATRDKNWIENMLRVLRTGEKVTYTTESAGDGEKQYYHVVLAPELDKWGEKVQNVLVISRNITELIKYEQQLQEKIAELEHQEGELIRINQYLDTFVYTAAHDLRSPVANLKLLLSLFEKTANKERTMQELHRSVSKLDHTLIGLVEVIEAQHSSNTVARELYFEEVWKRICSDFRSQIEEVDAQVIVDFSQQPQIYYVEAFLESIFRNMLSNALKYRDPERKLKLALTTEQVQGIILLKVKDNGSGMDLKRLGNDLFKPFSRLTKEGEGKGIGLHIVKNMIEKNGGRIEVDSIPDFGTSFYCYLQEYTY